MKVSVVLLYFEPYNWRWFHFYFDFSLGGVDPDQEIIDVRMGAIKHKVLILSGKGGKLYSCSEFFL